MSPKKRNKENKSLPKRWRYKDGWYRYRPHGDELAAFNNKAEFYLGKTYSDAMTEFSRRISYANDCCTMGQLFDRYEVEIVSLKAPATQTSNGYSLRRLRKVFANVPIQQITLQTAFKYRDLCVKNESPKKANLDIQVLSHALTVANEWGILDSHPLMNRGKKKLAIPIPARDRYVTDAEIIEFGKLLPRKWQLYVMLKLFTGRRKAELLRIRFKDLTEDGIRFLNGKNKNDAFIKRWSPELREIIKELSAIRVNTFPNNYLFASKFGEPYIKEDGKTSGFDSMWQRWMRKWVEAGNERFTEHDLRAKVGSDAESLELAQKLLRHSQPATTKKHYRRKLDVI